RDPRPHAAEPPLRLPGAQRHAARLERRGPAAPARSGEHPRPARAGAIVRATRRPGSGSARSREGPRAGTERLRRSGAARTGAKAAGRLAIPQLTRLFKRTAEAPRPRSLL